MTENTMNMRGLLENTADSDVLREMIDFSARRFVGAACAQARGAFEDLIERNRSAVGFRL
jgi:hypothetical protein